MGSNPQSRGGAYRHYPMDRSTATRLASEKLQPTWSREFAMKKKIIRNLLLSAAAPLDISVDRWGVNGRGTLAR
jgi:hypothetical protein